MMSKGKKINSTHEEVAAVEGGAEEMLAVPGANAAEVSE